MAAREYFKASHLDEVFTTSDTAWQPIVSLPFTPADGVDYIVFWSLELINKSTTVYDAKCRIITDGVVSVEFGQESRGTIEYPSYFGFYRLTGGGSALTVALEIMAEVSGQVVCARNANLVALRLAPGDQYAESLSRAAVTGGTETWTDVVGLTWAPDAGEYLVLGHSLTDNYASTAPLYGRLLFDGAGNKEASAGHPEVTGPPKNLTPIHQMWKRTVPAAGVGRSASWQGRSHAAGTEVGWAANRLLILKLSGFDAAYYAELANLLTVDDAAYVPMASVAGTVGAGPHLLLGSWGAAGSSASALMDTQVVDGGVQVGRSLQKSMSSASNRGQTGGHLSVRTYDPGERSWSLDLKAEGAFAVYGRPGSSVAVLDLGANGQSLAALQGSFDGAGRPAGLRIARGLGGARGTVVFAGLSGAPRRGFGLPAVEAAFACGAGASTLSVARRIGAPARNLSLAGWPTDLAKFSAGVRHVLAAGPRALAIGLGSARLAAARRLSNVVSLVGQAGLGASVRRGVGVGGERGSFVVAREGVGWGRTYVLSPRSAFLAIRAVPPPLRYSGQQFWNATSPVGEAWVIAAATPKTWSDTPGTPEQWTDQC